MCGRYTLIANAKKLAKVFGISQQTLVDPRYNIAPSQDVLAVLADESGARRFSMLHWGLIPPWADDLTGSHRIINARSESINQGAAFRGAFESQRCLIPADGFYEWQKNDARKQPMYIAMKDNQPFAFAGLWHRWEKDAENPIESCAIITIKPNELLKPIHSRMPAIMPKEHWQQWLDPENTDTGEVKKLLTRYPANQMHAWPVSSRVNTPANDDPTCIEPVEPEAGLFG